MKKDVCKHYRGLIASKGVCNKEVDVRALVGGSSFGWLRRTPCRKANEPGAKSCDQYEEPSSEEILEYKILMEKGC